LPLLGREPEGASGLRAIWLALQPRATLSPGLTRRVDTSKVRDRGRRGRKSRGRKVAEEERLSGGSRLGLERRKERSEIEEVLRGRANRWRDGVEEAGVEGSLCLVTQACLYYQGGSGQ
jgi:hypothetical protein